MLEMKTVRAFTLVELMVTIAVLAILATLAAPNLSSILNNSKVKTSTGDIFNFLQQARTEAVRLGKTVTICGSSDGTTCLSANKTNWSTGLIAKSSASSTPIQKLTFENSKLMVTAPETITFNPVGSTTAEHEITVAISGADTYSICVEVIGRAFKSKTGC
jgi:prepilin-type N-terminal cleavage/methylation domain-containing protein